MEFTLSEDLLHEMLARLHCVGLAGHPAIQKHYTFSRLIYLLHFDPWFPSKSTFRDETLASRAQRATSIFIYAWEMSGFCWFALR